MLECDNNMNNINNNNNAPAFDFALEGGYRGSLYLQSLQFRQCVTSVSISITESSGRGRMATRADPDLEFCHCAGNRIHFLIIILLIIIFINILIIVVIL